MSSQILTINPVPYLDGRPAAGYRLDLVDEGVVFEYGHGPEQCDVLCAREPIVYEHDGIYYMHYDGGGPDCWLVCLATSTDLRHWTHHGTMLQLGEAGQDDAGTACSPWVYNDGQKWHMFYIASPAQSAEYYNLPTFPYLTSKAEAVSPAGPWHKRYDIVPFRPLPGSYYSVTASAGPVIKHDDEYIMVISTTCMSDGGMVPYVRTLSIARTTDLDTSWNIDPQPLLPVEEQVENVSIYFEPSNSTWFLFTNHIGIDSQGDEYTDAIWVYWSTDINHWDPVNKAIVMDGSNCSWANECLGMPSMLLVGNRLAMLYDAAPGYSKSHIERNIGLAWIELPLLPPTI